MAEIAGLGKVFCAPTQIQIESIYDDEHGEQPDDTIYPRSQSRENLIGNVLCIKH